MFDYVALSTRQASVTTGNDGVCKNGAVTSFTIEGNQAL